MERKTLEDLGIALVRKGLIPRKRIQRKGLKKPSPASAPQEITEYFLRQLSPENILLALKDYKNRPIDLAWIVDKLLAVLFDTDTDASLKRSILGDLRNLILLGAVQDPRVAQALGVEEKALSRGRPSDLQDPFVVKLKSVGA